MAHILVFDSGVGGFTIYDEIQRLLPSVRYTYVCDNAFFPYGTKGEQDLIQRVKQLFQRLINDYQPDLIVVACNTASTLVLPVLRQQWSVPVVGVVPAIKPASEMSATGAIGLLATPATVDRPYTQKLIDAFASHCHVVKLGSAELVKVAEDKTRGIAPDLETLRHIIAPFFHGTPRPVDVIVMGCTHFPLLTEDLRQIAPRPVAWIDSGAAIARRVSHLLFDRLDPQAPASTPDNRLAVFTKDENNLKELKPFLLRMGFAKIAILDQ